MKKMFCLFLTLFAGLGALLAQQDATPHDRQELIKLFIALDGANWQWKAPYSNWDTLQPASLWAGVTLNSTGEVIYLDLDGNPNGIADSANSNCLGETGIELKGVIPPSLELKELLLLSLNFGKISGPLPNFSSMRKLITLSLLCNKLSDTIPFLNLPNLENLYLGHNCFSGPFPKLDSLPSIKQISLLWNELDEEMPPKFPSNVSTLQSLALTNNRLHGQVPRMNVATFEYNLKQNRFTFEDLLPVVKTSTINGQLEYSQQDSIGVDTLLRLPVGFPYSYDLGVDDTVSNNIYAWYQNGVVRHTVIGKNELIFSPAVREEDAGTWWCSVTNPIVTIPSKPDQNLILKSRPIHIEICYPAVTYRDTTLSLGETWTVNNIVYSCQNPSGYQQFPGQLGTDCDSFLVINIDFKNKQYAYLDQYTILPDAPLNDDVTTNDDFDLATDVLNLLRNPDSGILTWNGDGTFNFVPKQYSLEKVFFHYGLCPFDCPNPFCDTVPVSIYIVPDKTPIVITPNGDGINDVFVIKDLAGDPDQYPNNKLIITDAWGAVVFRRRGYHNDWNGENQQGQPLPQGTYYFTFQLDDQAPLVKDRLTVLRD